MRTLSFIVLLTVSFFFSKPIFAETIKVCLDPWPPMTMFTSETQKRKGVVIDMMSDIYEKAGYKLDVFQVPYARGMKMVADGLCDMLPEKEFSPINDEGFVYANEATFEYPTAFIIRRNDVWRYNGIDSIKGLRVATGEGWDYSSMSVAYQNYLDAPENKKNIELISGEDLVVKRIFEMIAGLRVDLYADNVFVLNYVLKDSGLEDRLQIVYPGLEKKLIEKPIFSLKIPEEKRLKLISIWDKGRSALSKEDIQRYLQSYNLNVGIGLD
jgi:polar amino acid transport system substrate-binding protein